MIDIVKAKIEQLEIVKTIVVNTIEQVYPHYYPKGAVDFFISHHSDKNICQDIQLDSLFLGVDSQNNIIGTITICHNEICRLFVLPQYQSQGYGSQLLNFAEEVIFQSYETSVLDASLPAKSLYLKRGYHQIESHSIETENGDFLCYDIMEKKRI